MAVLGLILATVAILYWGLEGLHQSLQISEGPKTGWDLYQKQQAAQKLAELKTRDTDQDGLSDFDEQYVYNTSIYLDDTDSDGTTDKDEIAAGSDPLCPKGENCMQTDVVADEVTPTADDVAALKQATPDEIREILKQAGVPETQLTALSDADLTKIYQETLQTMPLDTTSTASIAPTAQELRQQLAAAGMDAATLESLDDATLLKIYQENVVGQSTASTATDSSNSALTALQDLNADEIRDLLKQAGMSDADLAGLDDATIKRIFLENMPTE